MCLWCAVQGANAVAEEEGLRKAWEQEEEEEEEEGGGAGQAPPNPDPPKLGP